MEKKTKVKGIYVTHYLIALISIVNPMDTKAEPVFIQSGSNFGQGWIGKFNDNCLAVTAKHVIGENSNAHIIGPNGVNGDSNTLVFAQGDESENDFAVLVVEGELRTKCPQSSWGYDNTSPALTSAQQGNIKLVAEMRQSSNGAKLSFPVEVFSSSNSTETFTVRASAKGFDFDGQGNSGTIIRMNGYQGGVGNEPIGMAIEIITDESESDFGVIKLIRFDRVKRFVKLKFEKEKTKTKSAPQLKPELVSEKSKRADLDCSPLNAISGAGKCGYRASPISNTQPVELILGFNKETAFNGVRISLELGSPTKSVSIYTSIEDPRNGGLFVPFRTCKPNGSGVIDCSIMPQQIRGLKLVFDGEVMVKSLVVMGE